MPPENLLSNSEKPKIEKRDVWAIGIIAYELCTFQLPFTRDEGLAALI
jgi:serine/threonine protein kinase